MSAYHWKEKASDQKQVDSFAAYIKFQIKNANLGTIALYLAILGALSVSFNLTAAYIEKHLAHPNLPNECPAPKPTQEEAIPPAHSTL